MANRAYILVEAAVGKTREVAGTLRGVERIRLVDVVTGPKRVAIIASGGLSHFVVDEEIDQMTIKGLREKDAELLCSLPRHRLNSATSEIRNWVAAAGALEDKAIDFLEYVPVYRTPAGTGGGLTFARWT